MNRTKVAKVTISLPRPLLELTDRLARERDISRSELIAGLLEKEERERTEALMAEGYWEMAEENRALAEESFPLVRDMMSRGSRPEKRKSG